jgi:molecular chaperone DnaK
MTRIKIDYGIDLGTTNSAISRMESVEAVIKKTDTLKDTMPSCVYVNKKKAIQVGDTAYNAMKRDKLKAMKSFDADEVNSFSEFKRTMGTDKSYPCSNLDASFSSEELSAEIIKSMKSFVSDESFNSLVITVPAKFTINQKDATLRAAAEYAGFSQCELLQEPIAASMAYGLSADSEDGYWLVYDFGGGTFDAALVKVEEGIMKVVDTEGDNYLGGRNLDYAIVDEIIIPYLSENYAIESILTDENKKQILRDAMKYYAEETKIQMSFNETYNVLSDLGDIPGEDDNGDEFELDITVTQTMMNEILGPIFQKSIDLSKALLERNNLDGSSLNTLLLVGGPTYSPVLRRMLEEQITKPDLSVDPMTVVAKGAALFASTVSVADEVREQGRDREKIQLEFGYEATTVEEEEFVAVKILKDKMTGEIPDKVFVDIVRGDAGWASGKTEIDASGDIIEVNLLPGKPNAFNVLAYSEQGDLMPSEPSGFTIIQGAKIGSATLPYFIGLEIKNRSTGKLEFRSIKGLEKNQSTPAVGAANGLKTQKQIRPSMKEDYLKIAIYQGEHGANGTMAINNDHVYDVIISGEDLPRLLPADSDIDLTIRVDTSERITLSAFFPALDHTEEITVPSNTTQKEIDADWLGSEIDKAQQILLILEQEDVFQDKESLSKIDEELKNIENNFEQGRSDYDTKKAVLDSLKRILKQIDNIQTSSEWPKVEQELNDVFYRLEETCEQFENEKAKELVQQFKTQIPQVIKDKNVSLAQDIISNMRSMDFAIVDEGLGAQMEVHLLNNFNEDFDTLDWNDRSRARMTLDKGLQLAANNPVKEQLRPIVMEMYKLLPEADKAIVGGGDGSELVG